MAIRPSAARRIVLATNTAFCWKAVPTPRCYPYGLSNFRSTGNDARVLYGRRLLSTDKTDDKGRNRSTVGSGDGMIATKGNQKPVENLPSESAVQEEDGLLRSVYIHPLSQIVLRHLQTSRHDWIVSRKLDRNLVVHRDGTFVLSSQQPSGEASSLLRIWTYYDGEDRKHWLAVSVNQVQHRFLLQDNMLSVWRGVKRNSLVERVQESVEDLMDAVEELE